MQDDEIISLVFDLSRNSTGKVINKAIFLTEECYGILEIYTYTTKGVPVYLKKGTIKELLTYGNISSTSDYFKYGKYILVYYKKEDKNIYFSEYKIIGKTVQYFYS